MPNRSLALLLKTFAAIFATLLLAASAASAASAAPVLVKQSDEYVSFLALDGNNVFWDEGPLLEKLDIPTGNEFELFDAGDSAYVNDLSANAGRVAIRTSDGSRRGIREKILVTDAGSDRFRSVASVSSAPTPGRSCGSSLSLGNITAGGSVIFNRNTQLRPKGGCKRARRWRTSVYSEDPAADPRFPAPPRVIAKSGIGAGVHPGLLGGKLLIQNGDAQRVTDLASGKVHNFKGKKNRVTFAELDPLGNLVFNQFIPGTDKGGAWLKQAPEYLNKSTLASSDNAYYFTVCGTQLLEARYERNHYSLKLIPNVFAAPSLPERQILPVTTRILGAVACSADRIAFTIVKQTKTEIYVDSIVG